jgi:hypothetical protein
MAATAFQNSESSPPARKRPIRRANRLGRIAEVTGFDCRKPERDMKDTCLVNLWYFDTTLFHTQGKKGRACIARLDLLHSVFTAGSRRH